MTQQFGDKLKNHRQGQELSTTQIGESCGIAQAVIVGLEDNEFFPSKIMIEKLASSAILGLSYKTLKCWRDALHGKIPLIKPFEYPVIGWPYCGHAPVFSIR